MKRSWLAVALSLVSFPAYGDFSVGVEYSQVSRTLDIGSLDVKSDSDGLGAFMGFNWKSSIFYIKHYREEAASGALLSDYEKSQTVFDWHWNKSGAKERNFGNTSFGLFYTDYAIGPDVSTDFLGVSAGGGFTRFLTGPMFVNFRAKLHLLFSLNEDDLFMVTSAAEDATSFIGYEGQAALGFQFGRRAAWSLQVGYKYHDTEFQDRFVDDTSHQAFVVMRFFVASRD